MGVSGRGVRDLAVEAAEAPGAPRCGRIHTVESPQLLRRTSVLVAPVRRSPAAEATAPRTTGARSCFILRTPFPFPFPFPFKKTRVFVLLCVFVLVACSDFFVRKSYQPPSGPVNPTQAFSVPTPSSLLFLDSNRFLGINVYSPFFTKHTTARHMRIFSLLYASS